MLKVYEDVTRMADLFSEMNQEQRAKALAFCRALLVERAEPIAPQNHEAERLWAEQQISDPLKQARSRREP